MRRNLFFRHESIGRIVKVLSCSRLSLLLAICVCLSVNSFAQVTAAGYTFAASAGTYTSISGTGTDVSTVGTANNGGIYSDDGNQSGIPIGFTFNFCGANYTTCAVNANGVLSLQSSTAAYCCPIDGSHIAGGGWLMPCWQDGFGLTVGSSTPQAFFQTTGSPGSRIFTVEWNSWNGCCFYGAAWNYQVKLYEGTNQVQFCYGNVSISTGGTIGIANSTTDYQTLPASASTTCNTAFNIGISVPSGGTILTWSPPCLPTSPRPAIVAMTGGGGYCSGGTGVNIGLAGSAVGVNYQLYLGGTPVGSPVAGIGAALSFGPQTAAGTYTATATNGSGCTSAMSGSKTVIVYPLPTVYNVTGGGDYCSGGTGVTVGLDGSDIGINYQLYRGGTPILGAVVAGTGAPISFGLQTVAGTYAVIAKNAGFTGCTQDMNGTATVIVDPLPTAYSVTGGGAYCSGGTGINVGLNNSDIGVDYQLYQGTTAVGLSVAGTGSAISFGMQTGTGTYTVQATDATTECTGRMSGYTSVAINSLPVAYTVTGGGGYCSGSAGANVGLSNSNAGITYQLMVGGVPTGTPVAGTGAAISFGPQPVAGTYTVVATNTVTGCTNTMNGSVTVSVNPLPTVYTMTGGGQFCAGGGGVAVGISGSDAGVNYQLWRGTTSVGATVGGTGAAISFGLEPVPGTYTAVAVNTATGCTSNMSSTAVVIVNPLPAAIPMTGGGGYCPGSTGVNIGLSSSAAGIDYQLWMGATPVGGTVSGTGAAIGFGLQTTAGTYTATATDPVTGCTNTMAGSENVTIYTPPTAYNITGGGSYCAGGTGVAIGLAGSSLLTTYQLYLGGLPVLGAIRTGTGSAISFGAITTGGTYTVVATSTSTGCTNTMTGTTAITVNPLPTAYTVTGGGSYCSGSTGTHIGTASSDAGVNYQLYLGTVAVGSPVAGTGTALDFGLQTATGTYTVVATDGTTGCTGNMANTVTVSASALPAAFTITGGGSYCTGGTGAAIGLSGSVATVSYQLYNGATPVGTPLTGGGTGLNFGLQTAAGTYTVVGTSTLTGCSNTMSGSATITIASLPTAYTVTGGGGYCSGGTGVHIGLSSSDIGVRYQLWRGTSGVGSPLSGTGAALDFGLESISGTYSVTAVSVGALCSNNMGGSVTVSVNPLPTAYAVTGGGAYCSGGTGVTVGLASSQSGVNYQLMLGTAPMGSPVAGTGSAISFGAQTTAGTYTVVATDATTGCVKTMTGSAAVTITAPPTAYTVTGGGSYCSGGVGVVIGLSGSQSGVSYQLYNGASASGSPVTGSGATLTFGARTAGGTYTVVATTTGGCTNTMTGSATVTVNSLPTVYAVTGGGSYCSGGTGVTVDLAGSDVGINYKLYRGTTLVGSMVAGTGSTISFGSQTVAGTYTVTAVSATGGCTSAMSGSAAVSISPVPAIVSVTGGGSYCAGGSGVHVRLAASVAGTNYQLWIGGSPVGSPVAGTGTSLDFGLQTAAGTYTATATNGASCTSTMSGSAIVYVNAVPTTYTLTGGGAYCSGGIGVHIGLTGSTSGVTYKLLSSGTPVLSAAGTGTTLDFGPVTSAGTYTVMASNSSGCTAMMSGTDTITVNPNPTISGTLFTLAPRGTTTLSGSISGGTWTSSLSTVATIGGSTGFVTGVGLGTTIITYTLTTGCYGTHTFLVTATGHRDANPTTAVTPSAESISNITVAPNPSRGSFIVKGAVNTTDDKEVTIQVTNMLGQTIYTGNASVANGEINQTVQLRSGLANGMYLLSIHTTTETKVVHIVIEQ